MVSIPGKTTHAYTFHNYQCKYKYRTLKALLDHILYVLHTVYYTV